MPPNTHTEAGNPFTCHGWTQTLVISGTPQAGTGNTLCLHVTMIRLKQKCASESGKSSSFYDFPKLPTASLAEMSPSLMTGRALADSFTGMRDEVWPPRGSQDCPATVLNLSHLSHGPTPPTAPFRRKGNPERRLRRIASGEISLHVCVMEAANPAC